MGKKLVLVTGATGYIAGRLIPELLDRGYRVRCLVRQPLRLKARSWEPNVEIVTGDVLIPSTLVPALDDVHTAYYLVHNMSIGQGYTAFEQNGARNFVSAAEQAGVEHIIYLGGLVDPQKGISSHMRSRIDTGKSLRKGNVPVTEFRAGVIVGPGSISFEMIRFMTELMPIIFGPVWLQNRAQPIAVQNVIDYLLAALEEGNDQSQVFEIGGPDVMSYADLMLTYGRLRGLWRKYVIVPGIPLWFMALGVDWMTPVPAVIATPLVDGMRGESIVQNKSARQAFPNIDLIMYETTVNDALLNLRPDFIEPVWKNNEQPVKIVKCEGFFIDYRWTYVNAAPGKIFQVFTNMGGKNSWLYANWLWKLRGWLDKFLGSPGLLPSENPIRQGGNVDYYHIEALETDHLLRLRSELKTPGTGWMEWRVERDGDSTVISQTSFFAPRGLLGFIYWYVLSPLNKLVFRGTINAIAHMSKIR